VRRKWATYQDWFNQAPSRLARDPLWSYEAYRLALFAAEIGWQDVSAFEKEEETRVFSAELDRAVGSINLKLARGFSQPSPEERASLSEDSLRSVRDSQELYKKAGHILGEMVISHRIRLLDKIGRLLIRMIPQQRESPRQKSNIPYMETGPRVRFGPSTPTDNFFDPDDDPYLEVPYTGD